MSRIPPFNLSGVLPPFTGPSPVAAAGRAPYVTDVLDFCDRFGTSSRRLDILGGFLAYRAALNALGFVNGFQWCAGSFVEDKAPNDLDVVTFCYRPPHATDDGSFDLLINRSLELFHPRLAKQHFHCDAYFVDFHALLPEFVTERTHYWFGLFSHRRETAEWKGLVQVPLHSPDKDMDATNVIRSRLDTQVLR